MRIRVSLPPWYCTYMNRFTTCLSRPLLFMCLVVALMSAASCHTTSIDAAPDGRSTWRSEKLELIPEGGRIHVNVLCDSEEPITVVLLSEDVEGDSDSRVDPSCAAATGVTRNGMFLVRFLDLPVAEYMVVAFFDVNGDGHLDETSFPTGGSMKFTEPHSRLKRFQISGGDIINVSLDLEVDHASGARDS